MIEPADLVYEKEHVYFVPQAILPFSILALAKMERIDLTEGSDGLDSFIGAAFKLDHMPFAVMHYRGHPQDTSTIYLPRAIDSIQKIGQLIDRIVSELRLPDKFIWRRDRDEDANSYSAG